MGAASALWGLDAMTNVKISESAILPRSWLTIVSAENLSNVWCL